MQAVHADPSSLQAKVTPCSSELNVKAALVEVVSDAGPELTRGASTCVSRSQLTTVGALVLPALSTARTLTECTPSVLTVGLKGDVQVLGDAPSKAHV